MNRDENRDNRESRQEQPLRIGARLGLILIFSILYLLAQAHFSQVYRGTLPPGPFLQVHRVFYIAAALSVFLCVPAISVINIAVFGVLGCLLFITQAIGPDLTLLIPIQIPLLMAVTLQLPKSQALFWIITTNITIFQSLYTHNAWGAPIIGGTFYQKLLNGFVSLILAMLFLLLKNQNAQINNLMDGQERLDRAYQKVVDANLDFQTYALFAREEAIEKERRRLAGELHDIIGYSLTNVIMLIQAAQIGKGDSEQTHAILEKARLHADESLREARQALAILRTEQTDRPRGANLFLKLTKTFQEVTGIAINIDFANMPPLLPVGTEKILYRLIQEGLTNAFRHGRASEVTISFWYEDGKITVRIRDNGRGDTNEPHQIDETSFERPGIGLAGLREQVEQQGGQFKAGPITGGFILEATIPLQENSGSES
uniref:histidine kinase n=1 Tax=Gracilinema caldarium TaxID=215591 RepID=A0A7C3EE88_9SPIR